MAKSIIGIKKVGIKIGREVYFKEDPPLAELILHAYDVDADLKEPKEDLATTKKAIAELAEKYLEHTDTITFIVENIECKVSFRKAKEIPEANAERLKELLKGKFEYMVDVKRQYKPTKKLLELAEKDKSVAELIVEKNLSPAFSFKVAEKK